MKKRVKYDIEDKRPNGVRRIALLVISGAMLLGGLYLLLLVFSPAIKIPMISTPQVSNVQNDVNRIVIKKIDVDIPFHAGGTEALEKGAWHRFPERGDPEKGGNFILSAHRFQLGLTPQQTRAKSPFYNLDKLEVGDEIVIMFNKKTYTYKISDKYDVKRTDVEIEDKSEEAKMTLYSCLLNGEKAGRIVLEAKLI